ncbi:hypothetical protein NDU88_007692 [Pleurodeles waltl]|uniref:Uncharacterized protein n=1 Tax=Pleurodeles waltl TaxID=8319 RepID=A0AAV7VTL2_PLEWA|nr:hypothetical protein NDU88_007692 [Pleurodeles waltl]
MQIPQAPMEQQQMMITLHVTGQRQDISNDTVHQFPLHSKNEINGEWMSDSSDEEPCMLAASLEEGAEESISTDIAGEPRSAGVLPEADGTEKQTEQMPDQGGEGVETNQSQSDLTPPEPVAGPSRENATEKENEKNPMLKRILTEGSRKGDNWPESQIEKRKEVVINETIEEVDTTRKEEMVN